MRTWLAVGLAVFLAANASISGAERQATIRYDGLYCARDRDGHQDYFRFYPDGAVASAVSSGSPRDVARWLNKQFSHFSGDGHYSLTGNRLRIRITVRGGKIDYWGRVRGDTLELSSHSHITGYRDRARYSFVPVHFRDHTPNQALQPLSSLRR